MPGGPDPVQAGSARQQTMVVEMMHPRPQDFDRRLDEFPIDGQSGKGLPCLISLGAGCGSLGPPCAKLRRLRLPASHTIARPATVAAQELAYLGISQPTACR